MKVKIFAATGDAELDALEDNINRFLNTVQSSAVKHTQTSTATIFEDGEQPQARYVVTVWHE